MPAIKRSLKKRLLLCAIPLMLGGCRTSMDNYFNELFHPERAEEKKAAQKTSWGPSHESWCYRTLGKVECFAEPQSGDSERLIGVDPPNRMPQTREEHGQASLAAARK